MEKTYRTISDAKEVEIVVKKSKFIGNVCWVQNKNQADDFVSKIKNRFKDARHNVVAYNIFAGGLMFCSDDGEPHGTAGKPILEILKNEKIFDVCVVVTRYFGGILLGTGGLALAYSSCCKKILENAKIVRCCLCEILKIIVSYKYLSKIENIFILYSVKKIKSDFMEEVIFICAVEKKKSVDFKKDLNQVTNGRISIILEKTCWEKV